MLSVLGIVIPSLAAVLSSILVWQLGTANRKQAAQQASRSDVREAFDSAKKLYEGGIAEAERQIEASNRRITTLEADLEAARVRERSHVRRIGRLEDALRRAGLAVPNGTDAL